MARPPLHLIRTKCWVRHATPQARQVVLGVFRARDEDAALSTHRLYEECLKVDARLPPQFIPPSAQVDPSVFDTVLEGPGNRVPPPLNPFHPIRSVSYLKRTVITDLVERGILQKIHFMRTPTESELVGIAKHAARVERRNKRKQAAGEQPKGVIPMEKHVWEWALTERGKELLFHTSKEIAYPTTGEFAGSADHLDRDQLSEIAAAPWAMRQDAYGFWLPPARRETGLPALHPEAVKARVERQRGRGVRGERVGFGMWAFPDQKPADRGGEDGPSRPTAARDLDRMVAHRVQVWSPSQATSTKMQNSSPSSFPYVSTIEPATPPRGTNLGLPDPTSSTSAPREDAPHTVDRKFPPHTYMKELPPSPARASSTGRPPGGTPLSQPGRPRIWGLS
ncbi:hypothetical protein AURDEDRAFT_181082 [Auricularia subglabra TFB-10046 SS5]|nr:hypothetical protein AURDEDRAFT_181082 [Auricularia subglabra TFB-10046 SS5]